MSEHCIFCRIVNREVSASIVAENDTFLAFNDSKPQAPVHVLVIPKRHVSTLNDASDAAELGGLYLFAAEVARTEGVADSGYRLVINTNGNAGQSVFHLHMHVLGGRKLTWPPG